MLFEYTIGYVSIKSEWQRTLYACERDRNKTLKMEMFNCSLALILIRISLFLTEKEFTTVCVSTFAFRVHLVCARLSLPSSLSLSLCPVLKRTHTQRVIPLSLVNVT